MHDAERLGFGALPRRPRTSMDVALVSEHASPLAVLGGIDAGGQNVLVSELARALRRRGAAVTVYTRRDDPELPERVRLPTGVTVAHVPAGPARPISKDELLPLRHVVLASIPCNC